MSMRGDSADTIAMSPPPSMERRGSRARRRMLTVDTRLAESTCNNGGSSATGEECGDGGEGSDPPVIDTTSVEVQRKADGSVAKVNEYIIVRDIGEGSSAEVKLCRLVIPSRPPRPPSGRRDSSGSGPPSDEAETDGCGDGSSGDGVGQKEEQEMEEGGVGFYNDLYAVKIFDRAELMRRGARFSRPRARAPDGTLLPLDMNALPENYIKVQREIAIMKKLVHPNIVQLVEVIDAPRDRSLYMVMEFAERGAVMRCVEPGMGRYECPVNGGCLEPPLAAGYFADIMAGLEYLHLHLIAHRDLKPENVLIGGDGRAKIADFGVSQYFTDDEPRTPKSARSLARSNSRAQMSTTEGTWCFWAPEMCDTREEGVAFNAYAADSWAAGVTLWCFLYGRVPFFGLNPMDLFASVVDDPTPIPRGADTALRDLLERLLAKDPGERLTVPEAREHIWVRSWQGRRCRQMSSSVACAAGGDGGDGGGGVDYGDRGVASLRGALLLAESSFSTSFSPRSHCEDGGGAHDPLGGGGGGGDGRWEGRSTFDFDRFPEPGASSTRIDVTEEDIRAAVTQASGFVVVARLKDKMHGIKQTARRLSNELGAATKVTIRVANPRRSRRRRHPIHAHDDSSRSSSQSHTRSSSERESGDEDYGGDVAAAAAAGAAADAVGTRGGLRHAYKELLEDERLRREEREEAREGVGAGAAPHRRRRASSTACLVS
eukprot:g2245.t1